MTEKEFTDLANKHLTVLESYQLDKDGNKQFNIFGYKQLFEAINYTHCCKSDSELLLCGVCDKETKHDTTLRDELHCLKCGNVAKE